MTLRDPSIPDHVPDGAILAQVNAGTFGFVEQNQSLTAIIASTTISASTATAVTNPMCKGALFIVDITSFPGSASTSVMLKFQIDTPRTAVFAARAAQLAITGAYAVMVYPGISASAGGIPCPLPRNFTAKLSLSTGATSKETTLSLSMLRIV